jgi:hypothetical protein
MHPNIYICVCVCVVRSYIHYPFQCMCENRPGLCVRAPVCDGDGSAVCARVGGLVLRARPEFETRNRASPACRRRLRAASARRLSKVRRRSTPTSARGTPRRSPRCPLYAPLPARWRALWRTRSAGASVRRGRLCAASPPMRAHVRTRACTRLRGALGVGTAARRGRSIHASEYICICVCV